MDFHTRPGQHSQPTQAGGSRVYACLAGTWHFWQNGLGLLHASVTVAA